MPDYQLNYQISGNKKNPALVFLHGFMGSGADWQSVIEKLSLSYFCITIDLSGHGNSSISANPAQCSFSEEAERIVKVFDKLGIKKCCLMGYSMGGRLAFHLMLYYPDYFRKVIIESATPGLATSKERVNRQAHDENIAQELENTNLAVFLNRWYNQPLFHSLKRHGNFHEMVKRRLQNNPEHLAIALRCLGTGKQPSLWDRLKRNKIPLLLVVGTFDIKFRSIASKVMDKCPLSELRIIDNAGHNVHFEQPERFINEVELFLNRE